MYNPYQVTDDVRESEISTDLSAVDASVLRTLADLANPNANRSFSESPLSIAKRTGGYNSGTISEHTVISSARRMAGLGILEEVEIDDQIKGRIVERDRLSEIRNQP